MKELRRVAVAFVVASLFVATPRVAAHDGPPFPIVSNQSVGPYQISVWTDPDATNDGSEGGQFWVMLRLVDGTALSPDTRAHVTITPMDRPGPARSAATAPVDGDVERQFVALVMDHEGRFTVQTMVSGASGPAVVHAEVGATYDLRPPPAMLILYIVPFVAVGFLWLKLLVRRRRRDTLKQGR